MISAAELQPLVERWLPTQRWFGGKGRTASVDVAPLAVLGATSPEVTIWTASVKYADGTSEVYQLPIVGHREPVGTLEHVLLGTVRADEEDPIWVYDALHDKDVTPSWLFGIRDAATAGPLTFHRHAEPDDIPVDEPSLVLTTEQSNTSLMFGDVALLKVFRRLHPGVNPDIEIHAALAERGARHVARLLGSVEAELNGQPHALAMLQEYLTTATDGWELAKASVRDLMAEADLHAEEAGGDFAGEAERLGTAVAELHEDLAAAFGTMEVGPETMRARADAMQVRLDHAVEVVPELVPLAPGLSKTFDALSGFADGVTVQRVHGDLHLAQALRTVHRWVVIDFEGEPMVDLDTRRAFDSALRDVAGMLRSFDYAAHHRVVETGYLPQLAYRASEWSQRNRDAFCDGYAEAAGADPRDHAVLLRAYEADKAVYEAVYEARNRPSWLPIPLASLTRLAEGV